MASRKKRRVESPVHDSHGNPLAQCFDPFYINLIKENRQFYPGPYLQLGEERRALIDDIFRFASEFRMKEIYPVDSAVGFLAAHIFDCAMSSMRLSPAEVKIATMSAFFIACKYFHVFFKISYLISHCQRVEQPFDATPVLAMEPKLLIACRYDLHIVMPVDMTRALGTTVRLEVYLAVKYLTRLFSIHRISGKGKIRSAATPSLVIEACCRLIGIKLKKTVHRQDAVLETVELLKKFARRDVQIEDSFLNVAYKETISYLTKQKAI